MNLYNFTVYLNQAPDDDGLDQMFEAGLDDCQPVISRNGRATLMVSREADNLTAAILSVVADLERAGFQATGLETEDLVDLCVIGQRTGRTRESARLLAHGQRGPGGFPAPVTGGKQPLWSWAAVREWFRTHYGDQAAGIADRDADILAAADLLLRAHLLAPDMGELSHLIDPHQSPDRQRQLA
ncbi:MAG: hypothetical protein LBL92_07875 [Propionibacteriaceae bacterium]|jgi:hypothetical protein|nr:hypothetical protein [Propionibacteriaceae bacterium]